MRPNCLSYFILSDLNKFENLSQLKLLLQQINNCLTNLESLNEGDQKVYSNIFHRSEYGNFIITSKAYSNLEFKTEISF
jgi:hypothetical protein